MNIIVFGGQGRTGRLVVLEALRRGYEVSAFTYRNNGTLPAEVRVIEGNARDPQSVKNAIQGHQAVINIIAPGLFDRKNYDISEVATRHILSGMHTHGVRHYQGQAGAWATEYFEDASLPMRIAFAVVPMFRGIYGVKRREDALVKASGLDWTLVRCGLLTNKPPSDKTLHIALDGHYKCKLFEIPKISRADVATFHVDILDQPQYFRKTPLITLAT